MYIARCSGLSSGVSQGGCLPEVEYLPSGGVCQGGCLPGGEYTPTVDRMTDTCENIIFSQLLLRMVTIVQLCKQSFTKRNG